MKYSIFLALVLSSFSWAESIVIGDTNITRILVNGGQDSPNSGVTCLKVSSELSAECSGGYVAIRNNNSALLSAALHAKATGKNVWFYYSDNSGDTNHCPGVVFTPCSVISIGLK
ncbi:hypothetical protein [Agaribacterium sp. ZY112]|uniref:hypothetical protein n=1 Tax=Agaribacterium sp. ZY112 TaxID=3233574 RepID=UPI003524940C